MLTESQIRLKTRLLKLKASLKSYSCYGKPNLERLDRSGAYAVAAGFFNGWNPSYDGTRFVENLKLAGLRFVGYADEIARLRHTGWYTNEFQDETLRGVVLQLPARHGKPVFLAAYAAYGDPCNKGAYQVDCSELFIGEDSEGETAKRDAARAANSFAEHEAEKRHEYQEAWHAGTHWHDLGEDIATQRRETLALFSELRKARQTLKGDELPALCAMIRAQILSAVESIRKAREEREKIWDNRPTWNKTLVGAFNEGAGL